MFRVHCLYSWNKQKLEKTQGNIRFPNFTLQDHWASGDPQTILGFSFWSINGKESELLSDNLDKVYCPIQHKSENGIHKLENNAANEQIK